MRPFSKPIQAFDHVLLSQRLHDDISNGSRVMALTNPDTRAQPTHTNGHY